MFRLENERSKTSVLNKRIKFIQDNQQKLEKLKQVYLNMKYNENKNKKTTDIKENESQTDENQINVYKQVPGKVLVDR